MKPTKERMIFILSQSVVMTVIATLELNGVKLFVSKTTKHKLVDVLVKEVAETLTALLQNSEL